MEFFETISWIVIIYAVFYTVSKLFFTVVSLIQIRIYTKKYPHIATEEELRHHAEENNHPLPLISIVSPAFNEAPIILDSVESFLHQSYKYTEVIIASDGGTDGTLEKMIQHFKLYEVEDTFEHSPSIPHKAIKRYFRSRTYDNLVVIDKENGGKADAQNAGIAIAKGDIVTIIDADSILEKNALIHIADIFERDSTTVGIGTPIGIVNDSNVGPDGVEDGSFPRKFWPKIQVLEYLRSFLLGRMALQKFRGLMIVSGAFGVYQKWILEAVGGYSPGSLAEDMDVDCKIWRFIDHNRLKFTLKYIPEVFSWSQVPEVFFNLFSQRDRWARGLTKTMWKNRKLFFNPRYKLLGLFAYPYYLFFEWLTPFIEVAGLIYFQVAIIVGFIDFSFLGYILIVYYTVGTVTNLITIVVESKTGGHYKNSAVLRKLLIVAFIEPLFYHWVNSFIYVIGNINLIFNWKKGWGTQSRSKLSHVEDQVKEPAAA